jgi:hypothetical protein
MTNITGLRRGSPPPDPNAPKKRRSKVATKHQLLTREMLDGRTNAAKYFDNLASAIQADLGGRDHLSTIELTLIEGYAGACVTLQHLNTKLALGQEIDLSQHAQCVSAMVRVATRLGLARRAKDILTPPKVSDYLEHRKAVG